MIHSVRSFIGVYTVRIGFAILPADVREIVRGIFLYHVPGALTENEKAEIELAASHIREADAASKAA